MSKHGNLKQIYRDNLKNGLTISYETFKNYVNKGFSLNEILNMKFTRGGPHNNHGKKEIYKRMKEKGYTLSYSAFMYNKHYFYENNFNMLFKIKSN